MSAMPFESIIVLFSLISICLCCAFLVFHKKYEDGFGGRLAMVLIMFGAGMTVARLTGSRTDWSVEIDPAAIIIISGMALFFLRHVWRFMRALHDPNYRWKGQTDKGPNTQPGAQG